MAFWVFSSIIVFLVLYVIWMIRTIQPLESDDTSKYEFVDKEIEQPYDKNDVLEITFFGRTIGEYVYVIFWLFIACSIVLFRCEIF